MMHQDEAVDIEKSITIGHLRALLDSCDTSDDLDEWISQLYFSIMTARIPPDTTFDLTSKTLNMQQLRRLAFTISFQETPDSLVIQYRSAADAVLILKKNHIPDAVYFEVPEPTGAPPALKSAQLSTSHVTHFLSSEPQVEIEPRPEAAAEEQQPTWSKV